MTKTKPKTTSGVGLIALTLLLTVLGIVTIVLDFQRKIDFLRDGLQTGLSIPFKTAASWPESLETAIGSYFVNQKKLLDENTRLKEQVTWLKANLANQTVIEAEYRRLKKLFESTAAYTHPVMIAEVLDSQIDANKHQIEINKGSLAGAYDGQTVIDENGVVGQITSVSQKTAIVSFVTDARQRIPVFIERNRLRMISRGSGNLGEVEMMFVPKGSDVRIGDKVVTSGLGRRYPRGYGVAIVSDVQELPTDEFMQIQAKPLAALDRVLEVLLISPINIEDDIIENVDDDIENSGDKKIDERIGEKKG